jgi:hypothetical protein
MGQLEKNVSVAWNWLVVRLTTSARSLWRTHSTMLP